MRNRKMKLTNRVRILLLYLIVLISGCASENETTKPPELPDLCNQVSIECIADTCKNAKRTALRDVLEKTAETLIDKSSDMPDSKWYELVLDNSKYNFFDCKKIKTKTTEDNKCSVELKAVVNKKNLNKAIHKYFYDNPKLKSKFTKISWENEDFSTIKVYVLYGSKMLESSVPENWEAVEHMISKIYNHFDDYKFSVHLKKINQSQQEELFNSGLNEKSINIVNKYYNDADFIIILTLKTIKEFIDTERVVILEDALIKAFVPGTNQLIASVSGKAKAMTKSLKTTKYEDAIKKATLQAAMKIAKSSILDKLAKKIANHLKNKRTFEVSFQNIDKHRLNTIKKELSKRNDLKTTSNIQAGNIPIIEVTTSYFNADGVSVIIDNIMKQNGIETNGLPVKSPNRIKYLMNSVGIVDEKIFELVGQLNNRIIDKKIRIQCSQCTNTDKKNNNETKRITQKLINELSKHFKLYIAEDYRDFSRSFDYVEGESVPDFVIDSQHMLNASDEPDALLKCELSTKQEKNILVIKIIKNEGEETITVSTEW